MVLPRRRPHQWWPARCPLVKGSGSQAWSDIRTQADTGLDRRPQLGAGLLLLAIGLCLLTGILLLLRRQPEPAAIGTADLWSEPSHGTDPRGPILFRGAPHPDLKPDQRRAVLGAQLVDLGDRVAWSDAGRGTREWRLPDQTGGEPRLPVLAGVRRTANQSLLVRGRPGAIVHLVFVDPDGKRLADINPVLHGIVQSEWVGLAYPSIVFDTLRQRGVTLVGDWEDAPRD